MLEEFNYTNSVMGIAFTVYGITALICYYPGGYIADKFEPRKLLAISLLLTSLGGFMLLFKPSNYFLYIIYGYWGITSILFCWGALIKATRIVGKKKQGLSFGILEAGRGLVASLCATVAAFLFANVALKKIVLYDYEVNLSSLNIVILFYSTITMLSSIFIWRFYKDETSINIEKSKSTINLLLYYKPLICQALIVFTAYSVYKGIDYYSQYFYEVLNYSKEKSAYLMSNFSYLRPIFAITAGYIADKISSAKTSLILFISLTFSFFILYIFSYDNNIANIIFVNLSVTMIAVFGLRGIYFSFLKETNIPLNLTGVSIGLISLVGFFPDIYIGPVFGYFLDKYDPIEAFQNCFYFLSIISFIGIVSSYVLIKLKKSKNNYDSYQ